ncbi:MAG TPA: hypothetical protein VHK69_19945, partial [Chitinophagaceae bacterium]|nr:hypothetical protein [Chitinophagaceae bacterium]
MRNMLLLLVLGVTMQASAQFPDTAFFQMGLRKWIAPGLPVQYQMDSWYFGPAPGPVKIYFVKESFLKLTSASPAIAVQNGDTLFWNLTLDRNNSSINIQLEFELDPMVPYGSVISVSGGMKSGGRRATYDLKDSIRYEMTNNNPGNWNPGHDLPSGIQWLKGAEGEEVVSQLSVLDKMSNGDVLSAGIRTVNDNDILYVRRITPEGRTVWEKLYTSLPVEKVSAIKVLPTGAFAIAAKQHMGMGETGPVRMLFFDAEGMLLMAQTPTADSMNMAVQQFPSAIAAGPDNSFYLVGTRSVNSSGSEETAPQSGWIYKYTESGNPVWQNLFAHKGADISFKGVAVGPDGGVYVAGTLDKYRDTTFGRYGLLYKLDAATGSLQARRDTIGVSYSNSVNCILPVEGGFILGGDTWPGDHRLPEEGWIRKVDYEGNLIWDRTFRQYSSLTINRLKKDENGRIVALGPYEGLNGGLAVFLLDAPGNQVSLKTLKFPSNSLYESDIVATGSGDYVVSVQFNEEMILNGKSVDGYLQAREHPEQPYQLVTALIKLGQNNTITGSVFLDANGNGMKDPGEASFKNILVESRRDTYRSSSTAVDGTFQNYVQQGNYVTLPRFDSTLFRLHPASDTTSTFTGWETTDELTFALVPHAPVTDLRVEVVPMTPARPGFEAVYQVVFKNAGTTPQMNVSLVLTGDSLQTFLSSTRNGYMQSGDTTRWSIGNLEPMEVHSFQVIYTNDVPPALNNGDTLRLGAEILPATGDHTPADNRFVLQQVTQGSFDPNDKSESHNGALTQQELMTGAYL